jgi:hypothetical protein
VTYFKDLRKGSKYFILDNWFWAKFRLWSRTAYQYIASGFERCPEKDSSMFRISTVRSKINLYSNKKAKISLNTKKDSLRTVRCSRVCKLTVPQPPVRNPKNNYHVHRNQSLDRILKRSKVGHTFRSYLFKLHANIAFPSTIRFPRWISYYHWK